MLFIVVDCVYCLLTCCLLLWAMVSVDMLFIVVGHVYCLFIIVGHVYCLFIVVGHVYCLLTCYLLLWTVFTVCLHAVYSCGLCQLFVDVLCLSVRLMSFLAVLMSFVCWCGKVINQADVFFCNFNVDCGCFDVGTKS